LDLPAVLGWSCATQFYERKTGSHVGVFNPVVRGVAPSLMLGAYKVVDG